MICSLLPSDSDAILKVINGAAQAYKGVIPDDRWKELYMSAWELKEEIEAGVRFFGWMEGGHLLGVAGIQSLKDTTLIRHAYVLSGFQSKGIGKRLLEYLVGLAETPEVLVGGPGLMPSGPFDSTRNTVSNWCRPGKKIGSCGHIGTSPRGRLKPQWC